MGGTFNGSLNQSVDRNDEAVSGGSDIYSYNLIKYRKLLTVLLRICLSLGVAGKFSSWNPKQKQLINN